MAVGVASALEAVRLGLFFSVVETDSACVARSVDHGPLRSDARASAIWFRSVLNLIVRVSGMTAKVCRSASLVSVRTRSRSKSNGRSFSLQRAARPFRHNLGPDTSRGLPALDVGMKGAHREQLDDATCLAPIPAPTGVHVSVGNRAAPVDTDGDVLSSKGEPNALCRSTSVEPHVAVTRDRDAL